MGDDVTATAKVHNVDVGECELADTVLASTYLQTSQLQNHVYLESRGVLASFVETSGAGWQAFGGYALQAWRVDVPQGIDKVLFQSRGTNVELVLVDVTAFAILATHNHGATEDTLSSTAGLPSTGLRTFLVTCAASGYVREILLSWNATTLP